MSQELRDRTAVNVLFAPLYDVREPNVVPTQLWLRVHELYSPAVEIFYLQGAVKQKKGYLTIREMEPKQLELHQDPE